eukprot:scaffold595735_cov15-Prasinocladus_malaysianus.AAC.2
MSTTESKAAGDSRAAATLNPDNDNSAADRAMDNSSSNIYQRWLAPERAMTTKWAKTVLDTHTNQHQPLLAAKLATTSNSYNIE